MRGIILFCVVLFIFTFVLSTGLSVSSGEDSGSDQDKRIEELKKNIRVSYDEMEGITWYKHKKSMGYDEGMSVYIGKNEEDLVWLRFKLGYSRASRLYLEKFIVLADDTRIVFNILEDERKYKTTFERGSFHFKEWVDMLVLPLPPFVDEVSGDDLKKIAVENDRPTHAAIHIIANAEKVKIRHSGHQSYQDRELKKKFVKPFGDILELYYLMHENPSILDDLEE